MMGSGFRVQCSQEVLRFSGVGFREGSRLGAEGLKVGVGGWVGLEDVYHLIGL